MKPTHRYTLLQARTPRDPARQDERDAFAARLEIGSEDLGSVDIFTDVLDDRIFDESDCLFVGGAGEFGINDSLPEISQFIDFLSGAADRGFPIFASCFGFHALVMGLGGSVAPDEDNAEVGTYELTLAPEAREDPLFRNFPPAFNAQLGHKDRAIRLPSGCVNLASSTRVPFQAFRVPGKPVYATQFHPELTHADNRARFLRYMEQYGRLFGAEAAQRQLDGHVPSPEANRLIPGFVAHFLDKS